MMGSYCLMDTVKVRVKVKFQFGKMKKVLEMDSGGGTSFYAFI